MPDACFSPRFIANCRCQQIGLDELYPHATNPFPWMAEMIDLKKEKNLFGLKGKYTEPNGELGIRNFAVSLAARAGAFAKLRR